MSASTRYCIFERAPSGSRIFLAEFSGSGSTAFYSWTGHRPQAKVYPSRDAVETAAEALEDALAAKGFGDSHGPIVIVPATGGAEITRRKRKETSDGGA
jgi:hypothetical protein